MIMIDVPMPERCADCPCAQWVRRQDEQARIQCNAMKAKGNKYTLVDGYAEVRPEDCPIRVGTIR